MSSASGQSTTPPTAKVTIATALKHVAPQLFRPFIWWMLVNPISRARRA
jgi:hypothetical protein